MNLYFIQGKNKLKSLGGIILTYKEKGSRQLSGRDNARLHSKISVNSTYTAALSDDDKVCKDTNATIPSEQQVLEAKDWVDNGSKL